MRKTITKTGILAKRVWIFAHFPFIKMPIFLVQMTSRISATK
jgi:hypothetical protein